MAFWFFLSTRFGKTVAELKATMPYAEFVQHVAFYNISPWGDDWKQTQALHATMISTSQKFRHFNLAPYFPKRKKRQSNLSGMFEALKEIARSKQQQS